MKNQKIQSGTAEPRILVQSTKCIKKSDPRSNLAKTFKFIHQIEAKNGTKNSTFLQKSTLQKEENTTRHFLLYQSVRMNQ